jgi:hypothetical protein
MPCKWCEIFGLPVASSAAMRVLSFAEADSLHRVGEVEDADGVLMYSVTELSFISCNGRLEVTGELEVTVDGIKLGSAIVLES